MAESTTGQQQRSFAKNIKQHSALQIRQSATATVKASAEKARPKLNVVEPLDYEGELVTRRKDLEKEQFLNILLFPQQDVTVVDEDWDQRTLISPITPDAIKEASSLFTRECLKFYSSKWHKVDYNFSRFTSCTSKLANPKYLDKFKEDTFELDLVAEERYNSLANDVGGGTPLSKKGYLHKGPFPQDGGISVSMKNYRKRWFSLTGGPREGGYTLTFYKDEKSSNIKGKISLDTCTEVKMNTRYKQFGFDLVTDDDRIFYPMASDSEEDMEEWMSTLSRAINMELEETDGAGVGTLNSFYSKETLRDAKKIDIRPELLEYTSMTDAMNAKMRERDRHSLFTVYPELMESFNVADDSKPPAPVPEEKFGLRFLVKCHSLNFELKAERNGNTDHIEPFFLTFALYDVNKGLKISENFHVDLNSAFLRQMVPPPGGHTDDGPHPLCVKATRATEGIFSVTFPHQDVYLVAKVEKVLQGSISSCAETYIRDYDNPKIVQKLTQQVGSVVSRLGQYRMPFAWAARPLFTTTHEIDTETEFSPLYRQDKEKLSDEDIMKFLVGYKGLHKQKLQVFPGGLKVDVIPLKGHIKRDILSSSYNPLKSAWSPETSIGVDGGGRGRETPTSPTPAAPVLEIQEFPPVEAYHPHTSYQPHLSFTHHLYVYPFSLKYDGQKSFAKARNITCCVKFKDSDELDVPGLCVIYCKSSGAAFTDEAYTAVTHHCTSPMFYEEIKIKLPMKLLPSHHLLFTFYHISCDVQKVNKSSRSSTKQSPLETPIGYAWQPLVDNAGRLLGDTHPLPVSVTLPSGYLSLTASPTNVFGSMPRSGAISPEIKWVDNHKQLFKVVVKFDTTIYSEDPQLHQFFMECQNLYANSTTPSMAQLLSSIKSLGDINLSYTVQFLPLVLTQLFKLLSHSSKEVENIKPDVLRLLLQLVSKVVYADGIEKLRSYIEYIFMTEVDSTKKKGVHDELARLLVQYLRQQTSDEDHISKLLDHMWFFLEVTLKSMAQYLTITKKLAASRKTRYPEDFGWNLQNMVTIILTHIREKHSEPSAKKANRSLADFVMRLFSYMDRGVVFKIVARYLEAFSIKENINLSSLKLEFIQTVCDHEHFVPLNLPFPVASENMEYGLSDEFCRRHFLAGLLLREVEAALDYEAGPVRSKTLKILRNLLAKHDCDSRYSELGQRGRIATLYFPLIPLVLNHVGRLDVGSDTYISPMLNAASMASNDSGTLSNSGSVPNSATGTLKTEKESTMERVGSHAKGLISTPTHMRKPSDLSLDQNEISLTSDTASALLFTSGCTGPKGVDEVMLEMDKLNVEETRDLLISVLFVLKHLDTRILHHWWQECMGSSTSTLLWSDEVHTSQFSQLMDFFDLLESCLYTFKYHGYASIARAVQTHKILDQQQHNTATTLPVGKDKLGKKPSLSIISSPMGSPMGSLQMNKTRSSVRSSTFSGVTTTSSSLLSSTIALPVDVSESAKSEVNLKVKAQGALANEVGLVILTLLDNFSASFKRELSQGEGDNVLMTKYFSLLVSFIQVNQSLTLQTHIFALLRSFIFKYSEALFKGSADYCGILCYEILQCCNSRLPATRSESTILLYLLMRCNFDYFKGKGFIRTNLQSTIAVSKLVSTLIGQSDANLRRSLATIATFVSQDDKVKGSSFPSEVKELMVRLKTVLSSTAQMMVHQNDHEKLIDLHYSLAKSYKNSPELRQTWLDSMTALHLKYGNYSEAAQCCIHIAGLVAEYLKIKHTYPAGCACFCSVSSNVALEESCIREDQETGDEQTFSERNLVTLLETSIKYLEQAERYEMMAEMFKLLQPFYEKNRDFKHTMEMYGKLHEAFRKVVDIMATGRRYLGTYFRVIFYGKPFGEDSERPFIYKEPKVTTLAEFTLRIQKLYCRKFGSKDIVQIIPDSGKVNTASLNMEMAYIQITHVVPYFSPRELEERKTKFEKENNIAKFVFETSFTQDGKAHGDITKQCMRKTILTTSHWFPYVKKRIVVIDQEQLDLSAIEVAIEAMDKKTKDFALVLNMDPPDLKRIQLLLGGSISTQVNQGVQEYIAFFRDGVHFPQEHIEQLKQIYRTFMQVCQEALELNGRLIATDQLLYQDELRNKYQQMEIALELFIDDDDKKTRTKSPPLHSDGYSTRRREAQADPHRMSAVLFHSISTNK